MTKKHYVKIAEILGRHDASEELVLDLSRIFREDNPLFRAGTFSLAVEQSRREVDAKRAIEADAYLVTQP